MSAGAADDFAGVSEDSYAEFMASEVLGEEDLADGAEIQRRCFNRITPPGVSLLQPMFPSVVPFDDSDFSDAFLDGLLGEGKNSVAIYPLSLVLDPTTRETLVYNAEGALIASVPSDGISRAWPEDADPARITLLLDLLPAEDVEPFLYVGERAAKPSRAAKSAASGGMALMSLSAGQFGIASIQKQTNGAMRLVATNGTGTGEVYAFTVLHTSTVSIVTWTNDENVVITDTNTIWWVASPSYNGVDEPWECQTTNLVFTNGVATWDDENISTNARQRFYAVALRADTDGDGLTDGAEFFVHLTNPGNPDTDGDGWSDAEELTEETDPRDRFSASRLARGVVLNEVLYDATGSDASNEWIEIYSAGRYPVDLGGFVIQVGDTAFTNAYAIPSNTWIDPGRFLLLGGSLVTNRDLEVNFTMPNRFTNDATAAVRLAAENGTNISVADCLMYGGSAANFNPNGLDATGWISTNARSAGAGKSLVRLFVGHDTDQVLDWQWTSSPTTNSAAETPDTDGDGLTDQEELTGSENPHGQPTNPLNADSDGDGLGDYAECATFGTDPNTWATDGDLFPWPPTNNFAVSNWWGSDSYETAHGWNPLVFDENTNGIPDSWEMAFPGTNLYADADGDTISNLDELEQNSNPFDSGSTLAQPFVLRFESSLPGWVNDGETDVGLKGWVKVYFEGLKTNIDLCVWVKEGQTQEEFKVEWTGAILNGETWLNNNREVITRASAAANSNPFLLVQDLGLHPDYTNTLGGEYEIAVITVCFLDDSKVETASLRVGKWTNAFHAGPSVKDDFISLDPDRFHIKVADQSKKGTGKVSVNLLSDSDGTDYDDDATEIELTEEPEDSGIFISTNMLLVSDDVDDDFTNATVVADDTKNDRTHKMALGGKAKAQYSCSGTIICEKDAKVLPLQKTVNINVVILRDKALSAGGVPVANPGTVSNHWRVACERYAQTGVKIAWGVSISDPPTGVDLSDGIAAVAVTNANHLSIETRSLISGLGTGTNNADFHAFYVSGLFWTNAPSLDPLYGIGIADYWFDPSEDGYLYNAIIDSATVADGKLFNPAHEIGHCLTDDVAHHGAAWNIMSMPTSTSNAPTGTKRFDNTQGGKIYNDTHCN